MTNTSTEDYMSIATPENVAFGYKVAGIGSRFLAALVDTIIILVLQVVVLLTLLFLARLIMPDALSFDNPLIAWLAGFLGLVAFAFFWGYYILFEMAWNGQTPGKRWVGVRVIKTDGTPITLSESVIRNLIRLIDFLPAYYGVGVVTMFVNEQSRRLGDLAAGTIVVFDRAAVTLDSLVEKPAPRLVSDANPYKERLITMREEQEAEKIQGVTAGLPLERLTESDLQLAETFLHRRNELANRNAMAVKVLQSLFDKMGMPFTKPATSSEVENQIEYIVKGRRSTLS
jgi:uncharacterized RDD family membrane protein YckC